MSGKKSLLGPFLVLFFTILIIIGGGIFGITKYYESCKKSYEDEIATLPLFDEKQETQKAASEFSWNVPLPEPSITKEEFEQKLKTATARQASEKFPSKQYSDQKIKILKKYSEAKPGNVIHFQLESTGERISGKFVRLENAGVSGAMIVINNNGLQRKYPRARISPDYYYLFSEHDSTARQRRELGDFEKKYDAERDAYLKAFIPGIRKDLAKKYGYAFNADDEIADAKAIVAERVAERKKEYEQNWKAEVRKIHKKHKFLGIFSYDLPWKTDGKADAK